MDKQIIEKPKCVRCKEEPAFVSFMSHLICMKCFDILKKRKDAEERAWVQE